MPLYLVEMEIEADTEDCALFEALVNDVFTDFFATLHYTGELDGFSSLRILQSPPTELDETAIRARRLREDRLRRLHKIVEHRLPYRAPPAPTQLGLFETTKEE